MGNPKGREWGAGTIELTGMSRKAGLKPTARGGDGKEKERG